jgi:hypothetical protein
MSCFTSAGGDTAARAASKAMLVAASGSPAI